MLRISDLSPWLIASFVILAASISLTAVAAVGLVHLGEQRGCRATDTL
jgi:hypothetical protein